MYASLILCWLAKWNHYFMLIKILIACVSVMNFIYNFIVYCIHSYVISGI